MADNGSLTVRFYKKPAIIPQLSDFTITVTKNGESCELTNLQMGNFDSQTNEITFSFDKLYAEEVEQTVEISLAYRGKEVKSSFTIDKMNTEYYYWDFEDLREDGSTVIPELSNWAPGTLVTTAEAAKLWIPGYDGNGTALNFDGTTYVSLENTVDLNGEWTFSAWIKRTDAQGEGQLGQSTLMGSTSASAPSGTRHGLMLEGYSSASKSLTDNVGISKDGVLDQATDYQAPVGEWVYLSIVRRDSEMIVYENSVRVATLILTSGNDSLGMGAIGTMQRGNSFAKLLKGAMDEIAVYEAALSPEKINELYLQYTEEPGDNTGDDNTGGNNIGGSPATVLPKMGAEPEAAAVITNPIRRPARETGQTEASNNGQVTKTHESTGITLSGGMEEDWELVVEIVQAAAEGNSAGVEAALEALGMKYAAYDITLLYNGVRVQPQGSVEVRMPIPKDFDTKRLEVYYIPDEGRAEALDFTVEGEFVVFLAEHFSIYAVAERAQEEKPEETPVQPEEILPENVQPEENAVQGSGTAPTAAIVLAVLVIVAAGGAGAYIWYKNSRKEE